MLKKERFLAVISSISGGAGSKLQSDTCTVSFGNQSGIQKWLFTAGYCKPLQAEERASCVSIIEDRLLSCVV